MNSSRITVFIVGLFFGVSVLAANFATTSQTDVTAPTITQNPVTSVQAGLVQITWGTNEVSDSRIFFGESSDSLLRVAGDIDFSTSHSVKLPQLQQNQTYYYKLVSVDPSGNVLTSNVYSFVAPILTPTLTVSKTGTGSGTVSGSGVDCGANCYSSFAPGSTVTLITSPAVGSSLTGWAPTSCGAPFTISTNTLCTATFTLLNYTLTLNKTGTGNGTVGGSGSFAYGTTVTPIATADAGSSFAGWTPASCSSSFSLTSDTTCSAAFNLLPVSYKLSTTVSGSGSVISDPAGILCNSGTCNANYAQNTTVMLSATPATGYYFIGWSGGDCFGTGACSINLSTNKSITANFGQNPPNSVTLKVTKSGKGSVTDLAGNRLNCGSACSYPYTKNTMVTLYALADTGNTFMTWGGACPAGKSNCTLVMSSDLTVSADFKNTYLLILPAINLLLQ